MLSGILLNQDCYFLVVIDFVIDNKNKKNFFFARKQHFHKNFGAKQKIRMNDQPLAEKIERSIESVIDVAQILSGKSSWCFRTYLYGEEVDYSYGQNCPFITFPSCMLWFLILISSFLQIIMMAIFYKPK